MIAEASMLKRAGMTKEGALRDNGMPGSRLKIEEKGMFLSKVPWQLSAVLALHHQFSKKGGRIPTSVSVKAPHGFVAVLKRWAIALLLKRCSLVA
eukprot:CAMPEP_0204157038 /NCGR_PEP_ID=MMETSP0361-20130328/30925_1 /ASSEMBLY_ACC=CAM_ASM_000343 /TAXON_ID=268821 /ORGANISM="Scrippsiella Hangoei, Strain SHTV-5" /LENGTH=94 /DNA_ID=CAMNT_0051112761 /DNA_START=25 /DNA_END=306 /DNA_ORIENTATION=+